MKRLFIVEGKFEKDHCRNYFPGDIAIACGGHIKQCVIKGLGYDPISYEPIFE
jgi:hypothetical protein